MGFFRDMILPGIFAFFVFLPMLWIARFIYFAEIVYKRIK